MVASSHAVDRAEQRGIALDARTWPIPDDLLPWFVRAPGGQVEYRTDGTNIHVVGATRPIIVTVWRMTPGRQILARRLVCR